MAYISLKINLGVPVISLKTPYKPEPRDLEKPTQIQRILNESNPDIIVNAAAYTAVEKAETEEEKAAKER